MHLWFNGLWAFITWSTFLYLLSKPKTMKKTLLTLLICSSSLTIVAQDWAWLNNAGGTGVGEGWDVSLAIDHWNNTITVGKFQSASITFGASPVLTNSAAPGVDEAFIVKTDKNGNVLWSRSIAGDGYDQIVDVSVDDFGNIYVVGDYYGGTGLNFGGGITLTAVDPAHAFLAKYDKFGNPMWARQAESKNGFGSGYSRTVLTDDLGTVYWAGNMEGGVDTLVFNGLDVENENYLTTDANDSFIVKYAPNGAVVNGINTGLACNEADRKSVV